MLRSFSSRDLASRIPAVGRFARNEDGSFVIFSLFMLVCMIIAAGVGIDAMRYEVQRTMIQNTADRAVLAAADLEQTLDPEAVVNDYFKRMGLDASKIDVTVTPTAGGNVVQAATTVSIPSYFMKLVGVTSLTGPSVGRATETVSDVEVALVLDNSGSMGSNNRLNLLKAAAKQFVDDVVRDDTGQGTVAISVVPFSTQVSAGAELTDYFNVSDQHAYSNCVDFSESDFETTVLSTTAPLSRTAHFDPWYEVQPPTNAGLVCPAGDPSREILAWSADKTTLKNKIDSMWAGGNTSIDVATKWGATLLDPSVRPLVDQKITKGTATLDVTGMPFDYNRPDTRKYLVVMSDGQNTTQYQLKPDYTHGASTIWKDPLSGKLSFKNPLTGLFFDFASNNWLGLPIGGASAINLTWTELFADRSVKHYCNQLFRRATGQRWQDCYNEIVTGVQANNKNERASEICAAVRDQGVIVFSVGMDTYGQGDATLADCASGESYFFDVAATEIGEAFSAISRQINQLRLTQ